jgi:hypothetical protein
MRCHAGDKLQIIHHLPLYALLTMPITDFALLLQKGEALLSIGMQN